MARRKLWNIPGGIHPEEHKSRSNHLEIQPGLVPTRLVLPLQQHIGQPAEPIVAVGDRVLKGQTLAEGQSYISCPVHAPTSGTISAISEFPIQHPSGLHGQCIELTPDQQDEWIEHHGYDAFWEVDRQELLTKIADAGIAGMGGAGFPSRVKLNPAEETPIKTLILNGVECEPYITADDRLMRERADAILFGGFVMAYLVQPTEILIAIEDNKPEAVQAMQDALNRFKDHPLQANPTLNQLTVDVITVPTKYPSGGEKQIIQILTGKEVRSGAIPADVGVVCQNVGTAYATYRAIKFGEPLITRITTFTGEGLYKPGNYEVMIGTPVEEMFDQTAVREHRIKRFIMGGPMMGFTLHSPKVPIVKTTNCIIAATEDEFPEPAPELPCIRCGACADACPVELLPQQLYWHSKSQNYDQAQHHNLFDCIECGACSYVCPSNIPLVQYYRHTKGEIRAIEVENQKADHARVRFEARQERLAQEQAEKEAKRKERAKKAAAAQKAKAEKAAKAEQAKQTEKANPADTANQTKAEVEDAGAQLETAFNKAQKKWKDACQALQENEKRGGQHIEAYQKKVDKLKAKMDAAEEALKAATHKQPTQGPEKTEKSPPSEAEIAALKKEITQLTIEAAQARTEVTKLKKQISLESDQLSEPERESHQAALKQAEQHAEERARALADAKALIESP